MSIDYGNTPMANAVEQILQGIDVELKVGDIIIACSTEIEGEISNDLQEIAVFGDEWMHNIAGLLKGECTIKNFKTNSFWLKQGFKRFEAYYTIKDTTGLNVEMLKLKNCIAEKLPFGATAGEAVEEEFTFKFSGFEPLKLIA